MRLKWPMGDCTQREMKNARADMPAGVLIQVQLHIRERRGPKAFRKTRNTATEMVVGHKRYNRRWKLFRGRRPGTARRDARYETHRLAERIQVNGERAGRGVGEHFFYRFEVSREFSNLFFFLLYSITSTFSTFNVAESPDDTPLHFVHGVHLQLRGHRVRLISRANITRNCHARCGLYSCDKRLVKFAVIY